MEVMKIKNKSYEVIEELDSGVFLVSKKDKKFVLRHFESISSLLREIDRRKKLKKYGINIPKIIKVSKKDLCLLIEFISEETMLDVLLKGDIPDKSFKELFNIYRFCRFSKIDLNYHPENFAMKKGRMYYLALDIEKASEDRNLENYGLYYWVYSPQCVEHLKELNLEIDKSRKLTQPEANKKIVLISIMHW